MKALSIKEPWASMIRDGKKIIETRTWSTKYRGNILLCASKYPESDISGKAFAIAQLIDVKPMIKEDIVRAQCDMYPGAYSWFLGDIELIESFDVRGKLKLFDVEDKEIKKMSKLSYHFHEGFLIKF